MMDDEGNPFGVFSMLVKLVEIEVSQQITKQVDELHRKIDEALSQESLAARRIADVWMATDVLNACYCSSGVDTNDVNTLRDDVATFREDLKTMKQRQWILDGEVKSLKEDFADVRQDGNGEQWHALKHATQDKWDYLWHVLVDEDIKALKADLSDVEEMKAGVRKMMPLFQSELESFQERLTEFNENAFRSYDHLKTRLKTAEQKLSCLEEELRGLSWLMSPQISQAKRSRQKQPRTEAQRSRGAVKQISNVER